MLRIYITRHGETEWNVQGRLQGWKDSPLTAKGIHYATLLGRSLLNIPFQTIYSSPSGRAVKTANLIQMNRNIPIRVQENFKEINFGNWEGKTKEDIELHSKQQYENFWANPENYNHQNHNGESLQSLKKRVKTELLNIIEEEKVGNVLIVTHAVTVRVILSICFDIPPEKLWEGPFIQGTSLTIVSWDGKDFLLEKMGDMSHIHL